jgi:hypothetical protein
MLVAEDIVVGFTNSTPEETTLPPVELVVEVAVPPCNTTR